MRCSYIKLWRSEAEAVGKSAGRRRVTKKSSSFPVVLSVSSPLGSGWCFV